MARGQKQKADEQMSRVNNMGDAFMGSAGEQQQELNSQRQTLSSGAAKQMGSTGMNMGEYEGFDPETLAAITGSTMSATAAPFAAAEGQINRNAAISGNQAGVAGGQTELALQKGIAGGDAARQVQMANAGMKVQNATFAADQRQKGLDMLNDVYKTNAGIRGGNVQAGVDLMGQGVGSVNARGMDQGWTGGFKNVAEGLGSIFQPVKVPGQK